MNMLKLIIYLIIITKAPLSARPVANHDSQKPGHPTLDQKLCVCQYQELPVHCEGAKTTKECAELKQDCRVVRTGNHEQQWKCKNRHRDYCERGFLRTIAKEGCTKTEIISSKEPIPACTAGSFHYFFQGHGRGTNKFIDDIKSNLMKSASECKNFMFEDGGCSTFDINGEGYGEEYGEGCGSLYTGRDLIKTQLISVIKDGQTVAIRGNQQFSSQHIQLSEKHRPFYEIKFDSKRIVKETVPKCQEAKSWGCHFEIKNQRYLCDTGKGIQRMTCCCGEQSISENGCGWKQNTLKCN